MKEPKTISGFVLLATPRRGPRAYHARVARQRDVKAVKRRKKNK